jgi:hypothetical protein
MSVNLELSNTVTLESAATMICEVGSKVNFALIGEPGTGKSSIMKLLRQTLGDGYNYVYCDVANRDLGDLQMPWIDKENNVTHFAPNALFKANTAMPMVLMLDEFGKGARPVQTMLHPSLEIHNRRLCDEPMHPDSKVFITSNLLSDGVGDVIKQHSWNRLVKLIIGKPDAPLWLKWALRNSIAPAIMAWVDQNPRVLQSYRDPGGEANEYIFNPKQQQDAFVTPRSLEQSSFIVERREAIGPDDTRSALAGCLGAAAAADFSAYLVYQDDLPKRREILDNPKHARVPDNPGAQLTLIYNLITIVAQDTIDAVMEYLERLKPEYQATFCISVARDDIKSGIAATNRSYNEWLVKNMDLI